MDRKRGWTLVVMSLSLWLSGYAILFVVLPLLFGDIGALPGEPGPRTVLAFFVVLAVMGLLFLAGHVVFVVWFVLQNRDMNRITGGRFLTVVWTLLLFVPVANVLSLYKFAEHVHDAQTARGVTGMHPVSMFLLLWVVAFVAWPVVQAQMDKLEWSDG